MVSVRLALVLGLVLVILGLVLVILELGLVILVQSWSAGPWSSLSVVWHGVVFNGADKGVSRLVYRKTIIIIKYANKKKARKFTRRKLHNKMVTIDGFGKSSSWRLEDEGLLCPRLISITQCGYHRYYRSTESRVTSEPSAPYVRHCNALPGLS